MKTIEETADGQAASNKPSRESDTHGTARRPFFMTLRDIGLWVRSARTDAALGRLQQEVTTEEAFNRVYHERKDPWGAAKTCYRYQRLKYDVILSMLPKRRYVAALDVGCGLGVFTRRLATVAERVLGMDISSVARDEARTLSADFSNVRYEAGDFSSYSREALGRFDLVVLADVLYYLPSHTEEDLAAIGARVEEMLEPGGVLLLANHCFFNFDKASKLVRRIHAAFGSREKLERLREEWRPFYLTTVFQRRSD